VWIFPLAAAAISLVFAAMLIVRFLRKRDAALGLWAVALLMYAVASFAMFLGALSNWTSGEFRLYWMFGAALTVPYLAQGELYLLLRQRWIADVVLLALVLGTGFAVAKIQSAPVHTGPLRDQLPLGRDVFGGGSEAHRLPQLYSIPAYVVLVAGALWSAWRMRSVPSLRDRARGTFGIAVGATIVAVGSGIGAGYGVVALFSISLTAGVAMMFWGFLRASRPSARPPIAPAPSVPAPGPPPAPP
jgi:hypothetical protein